MDLPPQIKKNEPPEPEKRHPDVDLRHSFNYVGGAFAYKNSRRGDLLSKDKQEKSVLITGYGRARPVSVAKESEDHRFGAHPIHNSRDEFTEQLEVLDAKVMEIYRKLSNLEDLRKNKLKHTVVSLTQEKLRRIHKQFSHLSIFAFNQMMCINTPDKRDFDVWYKDLKGDQKLVAFPNPRTKETQFIQVYKEVQGEEGKEITAIKHCIIQGGEPIIINESVIDKFGNLRQLAHIGEKFEGGVRNAVERFDDGTSSWTVSTEEGSGMAALKTDNEIVIIGDELNDLNMLAARNLGAEGITEDGSALNGAFSIQACLAQDHVLQAEHKEKVRKHINNVVDGASIPGLEPIFYIKAG